jgi:hypothetical protein
VSDGAFDEFGEALRPNTGLGDGPQGHPATFKVAGGIIS